MADDLIPPAKSPRLAGVLDGGVAESFFTEALDVASHATVLVELRRAAIAGSATRVAVSLQQSDDEVHWVSGDDADVHEDTQSRRLVAVGRRWFRARVDLFAPSVSTRWTERVSRREGALDLSENGRTMLALRADASD